MRNFLGIHKNRWPFIAAVIISCVNLVLTGRGLTQILSLILALILVINQAIVPRWLVGAWCIFTMLGNNGLVWILAIIASVVMWLMTQASHITGASARMSVGFDPSISEPDNPWSKEIPIISLFRSITIVYDGDTSYTMVVRRFPGFRDTTDLCLCADPDVRGRWIQLFGFTILRIRTLEENKENVTFWVRSEDSLPIIGFMRSRIAQACKKGDMKRFVPHEH